jgi:hypothetical protein
MYVIDKPKNKISKLDEKTFAELGFKEREHLQEWLADNPQALGEELLIIQKEFAGFQETKERLDLLALDKQGNLVIIENKLDDSGKDVTWQVLKYASYCASLTKDDIRQIYQQYLLKLGDQFSVEEKISEFFDGQEFEELSLNKGSTQRIMMVAGSFRKEVTSTVLWLMNYNIRIQCFKVTPFSFGEELLLSIDQLLPIKDTEDYSISMASKAQEEIVAQEASKNLHLGRYNFWSAYLQYANQKSNLFSNISPSKDSWIGVGIGFSGVSINLVVTKSHGRAEVYFNRGDKEENKKYFDYIFKMKDQIETTFGSALSWERMDENVTCRIRAQMEGLNVFDKEDWPQLTEGLLDMCERMVAAFKDPVKKLKNYAKSH